MHLLFPVICSLGGWIMRETPKHSVYSKPEFTMETLTTGAKPMFIEMPIDADYKKWGNVLLRYPASLNLKLSDHYDEIQSFYKKAYCVVSSVPGVGVFVYLRKEDNNKFGVPRLAGVLPVSMYQVSPSYRNASMVNLALAALFKLGYASVTNIVYEQINADPNELSFDDILQRTKDFSKDDLTLLQGRILAKGDNVTSREETILRVMKVLMDLKPKSKKVSVNDCFIFNAADGKCAIHIPKFSDFLPGSVEATTTQRLISTEDDLAKAVYEKSNILDILKNPSVLLRNAMAITGGNHTTGWGKSQLAKFMAWFLARIRGMSLGLPEDMWNFAIITGSVDKLKTINYLQDSVLVVLLDELQFNDHLQIQHWSEGMAKALFDRSMPASLHGKGSDECAIPAKTIILMSGNAEDGRSWMGHRCDFSAPIQRKLIHAQVTTRLLPPDYFSTVTAAKKGEAKDDTSAFDTVAAKLFDDLTASTASSSN